MTEQRRPDGHDNTDRPLCGGKKRQGDGTCTRPAGWGTNHVGVGRCKLHGGSTRTQAANAHTEVVERAARQTLGKLKITPVADPLTQLSTLAGEVLAWKELIADQVATLTSVTYLNVFEGEQVRAAVQVFERALDRCATVLGLIARLNIDERLAAINEAQADRVLRAIDAALDDAGVEVARRGPAKLAAARHLKAVT